MTAFGLTNPLAKSNNHQPRQRDFILTAHVNYDKKIPGFETRDFILVHCRKNILKFG